MLVVNYYIKYGKYFIGKKGHSSVFYTFMDFCFAPRVLTVRHFSAQSSPLDAVYSHMKNNCWNVADIP